MKSLSILVVEDNAVSFKLVHEVLRRRGHRIVGASSVAEARAQLAAAVPDVVLMDIELPGGGGEILLHEIRSDARLVEIPVVAVTASAIFGAREQKLVEPFDGYIHKPINTRTFGPEVESFAETEA